MKRPRRNSHIFFETRSTEQDAAGQPLNVWEKIGEGWAKIRSFGGSESIGASGEHQQRGHEITTAYQPRLQLTPSERIRYGDRYFGIESIQNIDEDNRDWLILVREWVSTSGQA